MINRPSPAEQKLFRQQYAAPKKPIIKWQVIQGKTVLYENVFVSLCYFYKNNNNLINAKVKAIR